MNDQETAVGDNALNARITQSGQIMKPATMLIKIMNFMLDYPRTAVELKYLQDLIALSNFEIVQSIDVGLVGPGICGGFINTSE
jgi:hypothetical protein